MSFASVLFPLSSSLELASLAFSNFHSQFHYKSRLDFDSGFLKLYISLFPPKKKSCLFFICICSFHLISHLYYFLLYIYFCIFFTIRQALLSLSNFFVIQNQQMVQGAGASNINCCCSIYGDSEGSQSELPSAHSWMCVGFELAADSLIQTLSKQNKEANLSAIAMLSG